MSQVSTAGLSILTPGLFRTVAPLLIVFAAASLSGAGAADPVYDVVAIGIRPARDGNSPTVRLATPISREKWRYYDVALPPGQESEGAGLSSGGTKLFVRLKKKEGTFPSIADLTAQNPVWGAASHRHRLRSALFPDMDGNQLRLYSDYVTAMATVVFPEPLVAAAAHDDAKVVAATPSAVFEVDVATASMAPLEKPAGFTITAFAVGKPGSPIAVGEPALFTAIGREAERFCSYPIVLSPSGRLAFAVGGRRELRAQTALEAELEGQVAFAPEASPVSALSRELSGPGYREFTWRFRRVWPDPRLYAPVLEFNEQERIFPSSVDIWKLGRLPVLDGLGKTQQVERLLALWYSHLGNPKQPHIPELQPAVYHYARSYPGSWLLEYWTYYPLDRGGVDQHPHDTEHLFVEVDKLLGRARAVLAAAHSPLTPNNIYSSIEPPAEIPTLPVFALVELGKHAMAPDINRDGFFTFGRDINTYNEQSQIWGIRDYIGQTDHHLLRFEGSMIAPRQAADRMAEEHFAEYYPGEAHQVGKSAGYRLLAFPSAGPVKCSGPSASCAAGALVEQSDHADPRRIYKHWVYPSTQVRVGFGFLFGTPVRDVSAGFAFPLRTPFATLNRIPYIGRVFVPLPGRLAIEGYFQAGSGDRNRVVAQYLPDGQARSEIFAETVSGWRGVGFRYERLLSNTFGLHGGLHWARETIRRRSVTEHHPFTVYFKAGPMFEVPLRQVTLNVHAGPVWNDGPVENWGFEMRVSVAKFRWRRGGGFGIRAQERFDIPLQNP